MLLLHPRLTVIAVLKLLRKPTVRLGAHLPEYFTMSSSDIDHGAHHLHCVLPLQSTDKQVFWYMYEFVLFAPPVSPIHQFLPDRLKKKDQEDSKKPHWGQIVCA